MSKLRIMVRMFKGNAAKKRRFAAGTGLVLAFIMLFISACSSSKSESFKDSTLAVQSEQGSWAGAIAEAPAAAPAGEAGVSASATSADTVRSTRSAPSSDGIGSAGGTGPNVGIGSTGGIAPIAGLEAGLNRKLIYKAQVTMGVEDYDRAETQLQDAIHLSGAYILQFTNSIEAKSKSATYVIKVPADGFSSFIDRLREIEKNLQMHMEGSDVTEEYVDLEARLQAQKAAQARLLAFMEKASGTEDLVRFSSELTAVQEQIEQIKGRMRFIDQNVAYSTVNVRLYEIREKAAAAENTPSLGQRMTDALNQSAKALGQFGQALLIFLAALLPIAAVLALIGIPIYLYIRSKNLSRKKPPLDPLDPVSGNPENPNSNSQNP